MARTDLLNASESLRDELQRELDKSIGERYCKVRRETIAEWFATLDWLSTQIEEHNGSDQAGK